MRSSRTSRAPSAHLIHRQDLLQLPAVLVAQGGRALDAEAAAEAAGEMLRPGLIIGCIGPRSDGHLADAQISAEAAEASFMVNGPHPSHFTQDLEEGGRWRERIGGLRTNASRRSHAELDDAETLDAGEPQELGAQHRELTDLLPNLAGLGGCCGNDQRQALTHLP